MGLKHLSESFTEQEHEQLRNVKGDRSWRRAILEEFGVAPGGEQ